MNHHCLTILCPPEAAERLQDLLLTLPAQPAFTSHPVAAHGLSFGPLSASEQVLGRAHAVQVSVLLPEVDREPVVGAIREELRGVALRGWLAPVVELGDLP